MNVQSLSTHAPSWKSWLSLQEAEDRVKIGWRNWASSIKHTGCCKWNWRAKGEELKRKETHVSTERKEVEDLQRCDVWVDLEPDRKSQRREEEKRSGEERRGEGKKGRERKGREEKRRERQGKGHLGGEVSVSRFIEMETEQSVQNRAECSVPLEHAFHPSAQQSYLGFFTKKHLRALPLGVQI